jgi:hypothetical protein
MEMDLEFQLDADIPASNLSTKLERVRIMPIPGEPGSFLARTPGGRLIIYDDGHPRPFLSSDYPAQLVEIPDPLLVTSTFVYAVPDMDALHKFECIARYPVDGFGFGPPEQLCNLSSIWGKYPEMTYSGDALVLRDGIQMVEVKPYYDSTRTMRGQWTYLAEQGLQWRRVLTSFNLNSREFTSRIEFRTLDGSFPVGVFPRSGTVRFVDSPELLEDGTMVVVWNDSLRVISDWRAVIE